jgi:hypothetical protein
MFRLHKKATIRPHVSENYTAVDIHTQHIHMLHHYYCEPHILLKPKGSFIQVCFIFIVIMLRQANNIGFRNIMRESMASQK